jgi:hypothetical protein
MLVKLAITAVAALVLIDQATLAADVVPDTVQMMQADYYDGTTCSGSKTSVPIVVDGQCNYLTPITSTRPNCAKREWEFYIATSDCSGPLHSTVSFPCTPQINGVPAFSYSCVTYPSNKVVSAVISEKPCVNSDVDLTTKPLVTQHFVIDLCVPYPTGKSANVTLTAGNTITLTTYSTTGCRGAVANTWTAPLDGGCVQVSGLPSVGRLLSSTYSVEFSTAVPGAKVGSSSAATIILNTLVAGIIAVAAAFAVLY